MNQQRFAIDALLRAAPDNDQAPVEQRRARFVEAQTKPLPADVTTTQASLGGRPALELVPSGIPSAPRITPPPECDSSRFPTAVTTS